DWSVSDNTIPDTTSRYQATTVNKQEHDAACLADWTSLDIQCHL
ncbi:hypothetical protein CEXT_165491, partial [Caerostris extrusa]